MASENDAVRDALLRFLLEVHRKAKSPRSAGIGIRDLQSAMKDRFEVKQQVVASNLDYLVQKGWVREVVSARTFQTARGTTQQAEKVTYKISDTGIDRLEGASTYERSDLRPHVNITNVQGVTVVGEGNVVNTTFTDLSRVLNDLRTAVLASGALNDQTKLNTAADIDTLQTQLQKPSPDKSIVQRAWAGVQAATTAGEFALLVAKGAELLGPLLK
ncbi:MAG TPA: hypothetical protein VFC31_13490 [Candidatus Limnocylindria bacterium]|nr:hypothetical protein [Candidatus Limnocylindria bacterium]